MANSQIEHAAKLIDNHIGSIVFVTPLLRAREIKMATALRQLGWQVILLYKETTPFQPEAHFDAVITFESDREAHAIAMQLRAPIFHVFSGAIDPLTLLFCRSKPGRVVVDLNDVFCPSLFNYLHERFEPTKECLALADALCCRDLQPKYAERYDGFTLPKYILLFQEYSWKNGPNDPQAAKKLDLEEVHVVSVGTFTVKTQGMSDSSYTKLARLLTDQKIHLHIYPHWFYRKAAGSAFNFDVGTDLVDYIEMEKTSPYVHVHDSLPLNELALALPQYDFGIISGGSANFEQELNFLKPDYMKACYSGRISDYLDARLPVLINPEVSFNRWLLDRLGVMIDLDGILKPGFREKLLEIKHNSEWAKRARHAAAEMSLRKHGIRLANFYDKLLRDIPLPKAPRPRWLKTFERIPALGRPLREYHRSQYRELDELRHALAGLDPRWRTGGRRRPRPHQRSLSIDDENELLKARIATLEGQVGQLRNEINIDSVPINDIAGLLNWPDITNDVERTNGFNELLKMIAIFDQDKNSSSAWKLLNRKNLDQLLLDGYRNFKRTIAFNYFTFPIQSGDPQVQALEKLLPTDVIERCREAAASISDEPNLPLANQSDYRYFVLLLWVYTLQQDREHILDRLSEPEIGNPIVVPFEKHIASQDIANSVLEYYSMKEGGAFRHCENILEIGGGYGRNAFVALSMHPDARYFMVDIPPALYVAQRYLSSVFKDLRPFNARAFSDYRQVRREIEESNIVFLLPQQLELLPDKMFDLSLNISSFGEMNRPQIEHYFRQIDRVTAGVFYTKQWKDSRNPFDQMNLKEGDYPVRPEWKNVLSRTCAVQTQFFESLYVIGREGNS